MIMANGLFEIDSIGDKYTWSNKQDGSIIYSKIDRTIANIEWFQQNMGKKSM